MLGGFIEAGPGKTTEVLSHKRYKKYYIMTRKKPRRLKVGDQVLILLLTDRNKLLLQWRGAYIMESCVGANDYRVKMRSKQRHTM